MKSVVVYYSNSGTTRKLANEIRDEFDCPIYEILPIKPYGSYFKALFRTIGDIMKRRIAEYTKPDVDLSEFDIIFLGYPIWASNAPQFVLDYINSQDLRGKTIIPFSTSGATDISKSLKLLNKVANNSTIKCPYNASRYKQDDFSSWLNKVKEIETSK